jgi:hypothetical protein
MMQQSSMQHSPMQQSSMQQSSMQQSSMQQSSMQPNIMGQQQMNTNDYDPSMVNMFMPLNAQQQNNPYLSDVNMQMPQISEHMSMSEQMPMLGMPQGQQMMAPQQQMMAPQMMPQQQMMLSDHYSMSEGMPQSNLANLANL